jgi:hypothetical protein
VNALGQLILSNLSVTRTNQTTPALDLTSTYNTKVDATKGNAVLQTFTLAALPAPTPGAPIGNIAASSGYDTPTFTWSSVTAAHHYAITLTDTTTSTVLHQATSVIGTF